MTVVVVVVVVVVGFRHDIKGWMIDDYDNVLKYVFAAPVE